MTDVSEQDFERAADAALRAIERALGDDADFEVDLSMGILTIEFADGTKYVVNSHRAARQIWMAADRTAWHFDLVRPGDAESGDGSARWVASKSGEELRTALGGALQRKLGRPVPLEA